MAESDAPEFPPAMPHPAPSLPMARVNDVLDGKYRLLRPLRRGSMGAIFAAENLSLNAPVAVKVLRGDVDPEAKEELTKRIIEEAQAAYMMDHPSILRVLDVGTTDNGDPYVVMEMLRGVTLAAAMKEHGPVGPAQSVRVLMPIASALATAHACSVVHRDVKPTNIFLAHTEDGRVVPKLIDFSIAKSKRPARERITQVGSAVGSPIYMSPEQIRGEDVTGHADMWGFCVTLFEMITGTPPFDADELNELFTKVLSDPPTPLSEYGVDDIELWRILRKGLKKDPAKRWTNMQELGVALAEWLTDRGYDDDVCASSLRTMWREPTRSARKTNLLSAAPKAGRLRRPSLSEIATGKWRRGTQRRSPWYWVLLVLLAFCGAAAAAHFFDLPVAEWARDWLP